MASSELFRFSRRFASSVPPRGGGHFRFENGFRRGRVFSLASCWLAIVAFVYLGCRFRGAPKYSGQGARVAISIPPNLQRCRDLYDAAELKRAETCLEDAVRYNPAGAARNWARLFRAKVALDRGLLETAITLLEALRRDLQSGPGGGKKTLLLRFTDFYLKIARATAGDHDPELDREPDYWQDVEGALAILGHYQLSRGRSELAIGFFERMFDTTDRPAEKEFARRRIMEIARSLDPESLKKIVAKAADRSILYEIRKELLASRHLLPEKFDLEDLKQPSIGILLPGCGRYRRAGRLALRGALVAAGAFQHGSSISLLHGDTCDRDGVKNVLKHKGLLALVGVFDPDKAILAGREAKRAKIPMISFAPAANDDSDVFFKIVPGSEIRARALAMRLLSLHDGASAAIVAPDSDRSLRIAQVFGEALRHGGGNVADEIVYSANETNYISLGERLMNTQFDAIFVADGARRLALIAPALAKAGLWARPIGEEAPPEGRPFLLLATAEGADQKLIDRAGRYLQGAIFAPGYCPDDQFQASRGFLRRFRALTSASPTLVEALSHDAVVALREAIVHHGERSEGIEAALISKKTTGLTGQISFAPDGRRNDPGTLCTLKQGKFLILEP